MEKQINPATLEKQQKHIITVLKEMFKRVNAPWKGIDYCRKEHWFWNYEWTEKEQDDFSEWVKEYLKGSKEAQRELMEFPSNNKQSLQKWADMFIMNYGWKLKTEKKK